ncbi:MAG TPA: diacylglycerol kinase family protein [Vicinamibacteria bacterium]|jgi:diacylglycerol kinase family enzyme
MRAAVLLNTTAKAMKDEPEAQAERVAEAFRAAGISADVRAVACDRIPEETRVAAATDVDVVVLGGGDGTISSGAEVLVGGDKRLGVLPLGTLNHFARDLGIPIELDGAVRAIAEGAVRQVDVGDANGRVFLNNSSLGLYPEMVRGREQLRQCRGHGRVLAMIKAGVEVFRRMPVMAVTLRAMGRATRFVTPFVFVGNNRYEMSLFERGVRPALDKGELSVYVARNTGRFGILRLGLSALLGRLDQARDFEATCVPELDLEARRTVIHLAVDGEVVPMSLPIRFRVRERALRVLAPAPAA